MPQNDELRIYIVFRRDLPEMTRAKGEVQAAHAVGTLIYKHATALKWDLLGEYFFGSRHEPSGPLGWVAQVKIAMEVKHEQDLNDLANLLCSPRDPMPYAKIRDEGRTCFPEPTFTCLAFGPCTKDQAKPYLDAVKARLRT